MRRWDWTVRPLVLTIVLVFSVSAAASDRSELEAAKRARAELMKNAKQRKYRDHWERVIDRFLAVARKHPRSPAAPAALYNAAELRAELSRLSTPVDADSAVELYQRIVDRYPKDRHADDAAMQIAKIHIDRQGDLAAGKIVLEQILRKWPHGDMKPRARSLLVRLKSVRPERSERAAMAQSKGLPEDTHARTEAIARAGRELPLAQQLGLGIRKVAIDAGHGGHDTGGLGVGGVREKDIALDIARSLGAELRELGLDVVMIRDDDKFVPLAQRARMANDAGADLFLSIHCNDSNRATGTGVETYYLDVTSDRYSMRLAARENAESDATVSDLQFILADLATKANVDESQRLAARVQKSLVRGLATGGAKVRDRGVKHALFYVLLGAKMPAILVETGFLSNPTEGKRLATPAYRQSVAKSIRAGVEKFLAERESLAANL